MSSPRLPPPSYLIQPTNSSFHRKINSRSVFLGYKYAIAQFLTQDPHPSGHRGWIINTASIMGLLGIKGSAGAYCASKGAVVQLTRQIAATYGAEKIHCNALCPGCKLSVPFSSAPIPDHIRIPLNSNGPVYSDYLAVLNFTSSITLGRKRSKA